LSLALHCDHAGCNSWARQGLLTKDWLTVTDSFGNVAHCCTLDHLMRWAASRSEPTLEVPL